MPNDPLLLVSCSRCQRLHPPLRNDVANPLCGRCVLPRARARSPSRHARTRAAGKR